MDPVGTSGPGREHPRPPGCCWARRAPGHWSLTALGAAVSLTLSWQTLPALASIGVSPSFCCAVARPQQAAAGRGGFVGRLTPRCCLIQLSAEPPAASHPGRTFWAPCVPLGTISFLPLLTSIALLRSLGWSHPQTSASRQPRAVSRKWDIRHGRPGLNTFPDLSRATCKPVLERQGETMRARAPASPLSLRLTFLCPRSPGWRGQAFSSSLDVLVGSL